MERRSFMNNIDVENAKLDPSEHFDDPKEVFDNPEINDDDKITILKQWDYDLRELLVAEEENMPADEEGETMHEKMQLIRECLQNLGASEDSESNSK